MGRSVRGDSQIVIVLVGFLGAHDGLFHAAAGDETGRVGENQDGCHNAELGRSSGVRVSTPGQN